MKSSMYPLFLLSLITLSNIGFAQTTTYKISSNKNWSAVLPASCIGCTVNISTGVTLTIDESATCMNCTFNGGSISMSNESLSLLYSGSQTTTYFSGTSLTAIGTASVSVNAPLSLTNTTFTFNGSASFTTSYEVDLTASRIYLNDNSTMTSTGGSSTTINLISTSQIVVGNGSQLSNAWFLVNGPTLNVYDKSAVNISNDNNAVFNWSNYDYYPNVNASSHASKSFSTLNNTVNCGSGYPHACANPAVYGPATLASAGIVPGNTLPVVLDGFTATLENDRTIALEWNTQMEVNAGHFTIQRSADGETWENIGTIQARGNSATTTEYSFADQQPLSGTNYYRLQMVDDDNSFTYSTVKVLRTSMVGNVSFFPNPARDYVNVALGNAINTAETVTVRLINMSGQVMQEQRTSATAGTVISFRVSNYASGVYILSVAGQDGFQESRQLMISKM